MNKFKLHTVASAPASRFRYLMPPTRAWDLSLICTHIWPNLRNLTSLQTIGDIARREFIHTGRAAGHSGCGERGNRCTYCVAAHSFIARNMVKLPADTITALRSSDTLPDAKLNALAAFIRAVVRERGWVADSHELKNFFAASYTQQQVLEVVLGVSMKTLSNYINHLTDTPLDAAFADEAWMDPNDHARGKS